MQNQSRRNKQSYDPLTPKLALQLAAVHTWPAAILPCLIAIACAAGGGHPINAVVSIVLLAICILMQAAVNTFNDYYDFKKGTDSAADDVDPTDATLIFNNVNPQQVLAYAIGLLVVAFLLGFYIIAVAGWVPLAIGIVGAVFVVIYSAGKTPISYLPLGEVVSGVVMGGLIPLACYYVITGKLSLLMIIWSLPTIIGIGLIMMTNNTCDIEKDKDAKRKTLPVVLGRSQAIELYHALMLGWIGCIIVIVALWFTKGLIFVPFLLLVAWPVYKILLGNPLRANSRRAAMGQILNLNIALGAMYAVCILANCASVSLL